MKILAIRGANLASLEGAFELDLVDGTLGTAGLFAITGPTGAGKSTLLDALCLPLFNQTPRLKNRGGVEIGSDGLGEHDVRSLLRRGATAGHAEVDFRGRDAHVYRARWEVRRKRTGTLDVQKLTLHDLTAEVNLTCHRQQDTLTAIGDRLGLSFDQFRRSALLAQNDFAAFLKADGNERATLLERMTGTEVYGVLSRRAFERARLARQAVQAQADAAGGLAILEPEARAAKEAELARCVLDRTTSEAEARACEAAVRWYEELTRMQTAERSQHEAVEVARTASEALADQRDYLQLVLAAQPHRAALATADRLEAELPGLEATLAEQHQQAVAARQAAEQASATHQAALAALDLARQALAMARPAIDQARNLDVLVETAAAAATEAEATAAEAEARSARAEQEATRLQQTVQQAVSRRDDIAAWQARHPEIAPLASQWGRWQRDLDHHASASLALEAARAQEQAAQTHATALATALGQAEQALAAVASAGASAQAEALRTAAEAERFPLAPLATQREVLTRKQGGLLRLERIAERALALHERLTEQLDLAARARDSQTRHVADEAQAREQRLLSAAVLDEARSARERLRAALSLADHRSRLTPGDPCPLCGALEHPYASQELSGVACEQEARVNQLEAELVALDARIQSAGKLAAEAEAQARGALTRAQAERQARSALVAQWREAATGTTFEPIDLPGDDSVSPASPLEPGGQLSLLHQEAPEGPDATTSQLTKLRNDLTAHLADCDDALKALAAKEAEGLALEQAAKAAAQQLEAARARTEAAERAVNRAREDLTAASFEVERLGTEARTQRDSIERALADLAPAFESRPDWRQRLEADRASFAAACAKEVAQWQTQAAALEQTVRELAVLEPRAAEAAAMAAAATQQAQAARGQAHQAATVLDRHRQERQGLLEGRPTAVVERTLQAAVEQASTALEAALAAAQAAQMRATEATTRAGATQGAVEKLRLEVAEARKALDAILSALGIPAGELRARLGREPAWIEARQAELQLAGDRLKEAQAVLLERTRQRQEHEDRNRPPLDEPSQRAALTTALANKQAAEAQEAGLRAQLLADDRNREQARDLTAKLAELEAGARTWEALNKLIGSDNGMRFRRFAQSLTLDHLVSLANQHLCELTPRYRLMRVPAVKQDRHDLELQVVDLHMGEEVRSASSLSGGESFLVSLALALGLSSLASKDTRIDSLFIDEGFGTLDPVTLETALAALDALQAQGRQVGLISHVPGMAERIGVQVQVVPLGGGRSALRVSGPPHSLAPGA